jgi:hypothetical protein
MSFLAQVLITAIIVICIVTAVYIDKIRNKKEKSDFIEQSELTEAQKMRAIAIDKNKVDRQKNEEIASKNYNSIIKDMQDKIEKFVNKGFFHTVLPVDMVGFYHQAGEYCNLIKTHFTNKGYKVKICQKTSIALVTISWQ